MLSLVDDLDRVCTFGSLLQGLAASRTPLLVALNSLGLEHLPGDRMERVALSVPEPSEIFRPAYSM